MCRTKVNVVTCEYIDFCSAHVTTLTVIYKMYNNCAITFNLHDKLFHGVATIVVFNNDFYQDKVHSENNTKFVLVKYKLETQPNVFPLRTDIWNSRTKPAGLDF